MPNMSYCRFQNTSQDLGDCYRWLGENHYEDLSEDEKDAFTGILKMSFSLLQDYSEEILGFEIEKADEDV